MSHIPDDKRPVASELTVQPDPKSIYFPPGGILLWIIIFIEVITFAIGIAAFLVQRGQDLESFSQSQTHLSATLGTINTLVLLTGGFLMATALHELRAGNQQKSLAWIRGAAALGFVFLAIKSFEYYTKIEHGLGIDYDSFFTFYWLLTGFHFIHVLVATVILLLVARGIRKGAYSKMEYLDVESAGAFWHMCDLIWLLLFPVLYLMH